jgi:hypothetical protein
MENPFHTALQYPKMRRSLPPSHCTFENAKTKKTRAITEPFEDGKSKIENEKPLPGTGNLRS